MNIEKITLKNFRCFSDFTVKFNDRMTVFIGDNATGKTSILISICKAFATLYGVLPSPQALVDPNVYDFPQYSSEMTSIKIVTSAGKIHIVSPQSPTHLAHKQFFKMTKETGNDVDSLFRNMITAINAVREHKNDPIPIFRLYSLSRCTWEPLPQNQSNENEHPRLQSFSTSFNEHWRFSEFSLWIQNLENDFYSKVYKDKGYISPVLNAVKNAITTCLCNYEDIRTELYDNDPFIVLTEKKTGKTAFLHQLSSGYMSIISIVADLACRMAKTNPQLKNPLESEGIVLIDEIDLSLHPKWQQRVLGDLLKVFPNVQFIVTTHSPLALTTVHPENIVRLVRTEDGDVAAQYGKDLGISTYGADAMRLMRYFMDVFPRPQISKKLIDSYFALIDEGKGETNKALKLRNEIKQMMPDDNILRQADELIAHVKRFS